jgi:hypothetical protein
LDVRITILVVPGSRRIQCCFRFDRSNGNCLRKPSSAKVTALPLLMFVNFSKIRVGINASLLDAVLDLKTY